MDTQKLANYIENLRYERKIKQDDFIEHITSPRQYQRYRAGESEMPVRVIYKFAKKLNISPIKLLTEYDTKINEETTMLERFFNHVIQRNMVASNLDYEILSKRKFIDDENYLFYQLSKSLLFMYNGHYSKIYMIECIKEIIDYDKLMQRTLISDFELFALGILMEHDHVSREVILDKIMKIKTGDLLFLSGNSLFVNLQIYYWIAKNLGKLNRYKEVIGFATDAINLCHKNYSIYSLHQFLYFRALAKHKISHSKNYLEDLKKIAYLTRVIPSINTDYYQQLMLKDFNIDVFQL